MKHECSELGNARRLVEAHGRNMRHASEWGTWLAWDGTRWRRDITGDVERLAKRIVDSIYTEIGAEPNDGRRKELFKHWMKSQSSNAILAMMRLARSEPGVSILSDELDADPWLLNVANGTVDLRDGSFREHRQADLLTRKVNIAYDASATCPTWEAFLERTVPDVDVRNFLQRAVGYTLTGLVAEQVLFFLHGVGANGKSTFQRALLALAGDYGTQTEPDLLLARRSEPHPTGVADLVGRRLAVAVEVDQGRRMAESLVKQLTGGDRLKARFMRQDFFEFNPTHKLWLAANHKPIVHGTDHAIWRRIRLVPFEVTIPVDEQDHELEQKLRDELPGILRWAIAGTATWRAHGLRAPASVVAATGAYRSEMDLFGGFLADATIAGPDLECAATDLFNRYKEWCDEANEKPTTKTAFGRELTERGYRAVKRGKRGARYWIGLARNTDLTLSELVERENAPAENPQVNLDFAAKAGAFDADRGMTPRENASRDSYRENATRPPNAPASHTAREEPDLDNCPDCGKRVERSATNHGQFATRCAACIAEAFGTEKY